MNSSPLMLFVLDKDIDNVILEHARSWDADAGWNLWLTTESYEDMPRDSPNGVVYGTELPIPESYKSPWYGKTVEDCARWLQAAPNDVASDKRHFAAMNEFSKDDSTVLLCSIKTGDGKFKVDYFPVATKYIAVYLHTRNGDQFEESFGGYQRRRKDEGKPDRSKGGPYS
ncbi:hypothetical protein GQ44DRAFT_632234 [Phaeosphaeriaceae sp. PMI808]|nr:hypothetical protein GQ44DRAFT_632234 [Phaeosphaeriaceae sp. PMI808]